VLPMDVAHSEEERIKAFWHQVYLKIPEPPKNWEQVSKPCKWSKIIKEQQGIK